MASPKPLATSYSPLGTAYLRKLSDDFSIWQHTASQEVDLQHGYALDDAARGLIVAVLYQEKPLIAAYGSFLRTACCDYPEPVNFFSAQRKPVFERGWSADALGEAWWAVCFARHAGFPVDDTEEILGAIASYLPPSGPLRSCAYRTLGNDETSYSAAFIDRILHDWESMATPDWNWPENSIRYGNAILPYALLTASVALNHQQGEQTALDMLDFLNNAATHDGKPIAIGNKGWYEKGGNKALFDQQPIDPAYHILANSYAYKVTNDLKYLSQAEFFLSWFWGNNLGGQLMLNLEEESCYDGLWPDGRSSNRGAESTVCYLHAQAAYEDARKAASSSFTPTVLAPIQRSAAP